MSHSFYYNLKYLVLTWPRDSRSVPRKVWGERQREFSPAINWFVTTVSSLLGAGPMKGIEYWPMVNGQISKWNAIYFTGPLWGLSWPMYPSLTVARTPRSSSSCSSSSQGPIGSGFSGSECKADMLLRQASNENWGEETSENCKKNAVFVHHQPALRSLNCFSVLVFCYWMSAPLRVILWTD